MTWHLLWWRCGNDQLVYAGELLELFLMCEIFLRGEKNLYLK